MGLFVDIVCMRNVKFMVCSINRVLASGYNGLKTSKMVPGTCVRIPGGKSCRGDPPIGVNYELTSNRIPRVVLSLWLLGTLHLGAYFTLVE